MGPMEQTGDWRPGRGRHHPAGGCSEWGCSERVESHSQCCLLEGRGVRAGKGGEGVWARGGGGSRDAS